MLIGVAVIVIWEWFRCVSRLGYKLAELAFVVGHLFEIWDFSERRRTAWGECTVSIIVECLLLVITTYLQRRFKVL